MTTLFSLFLKLLFYTHRIVAVLAFVTMVFCLSQAIHTGEYPWWEQAFVQGVLWIFFWNFATFIRKNFPIK
jgi:hypothetical protein